MLEMYQSIRNWKNNENAQKRIVLIIVCVVLLLDNMLYMVVVPIVPDYLRHIGAYESHYSYDEITSNNRSANKPFSNGTVIRSINNRHIYYVGEDNSLGWLFAVKAIVQLFINPISGTMIDRIGYEIPLIFGLTIMFCSTTIFALGQSYYLLFIARSLQGVGSAFADTSGLAMIADRFTEENERSKAMGIALAFISFGSLVAPPFGGILYEYAGKPVPFLILAMICLIDGILVFVVIKPKERCPTKSGNPINGTPIYRLFADPFIAICAGALVMANVSLAFLEPTIGKYMLDYMPTVTETQQGMIWLPAFFPHVAGVYLTVVLMKKHPQWPWLLAAIGLAIEGVSCFFIPFITNYWVLILPLSGVCFGIALVDTALLPMLAYLVDTRHVSVYGSVYAIADISYSLAYAVGPVVAGGIMSSMGGFIGLNLIICLSNVLYAPVIGFLRMACIGKLENKSDDDQLHREQRPEIVIDSNSMKYGSLDDAHLVAVDGSDDCDTTYEFISTSADKKNSSRSSLLNRPTDRNCGDLY